jgi:hypothetical protein
MGCTTSKHTIDSWQIDDSLHVALNRDKKKGNAPKSYIPRAPHPFLMAKLDDSAMMLTCCESDDGEVNPEADRILYQTAHDCEAIDPRYLSHGKSAHVKC